MFYILCMIVLLVSQLILGNSSRNSSHIDTCRLWRKQSKTLLFRYESEFQMFKIWYHILCSNFFAECKFWWWFRITTRYHSNPQHLFTSHRRLQKGPLARSLSALVPQCLVEFSDPVQAQNRGRVQRVAPKNEALLRAQSEDSDGLGPSRSFGQCI